MSQALDGVTVLDVSTMLAGPSIATMLGDFGATVIKVEHPQGDPQRHHGKSKDGLGLWWKINSRNKHCVTLDLHGEEGQDQLLRLVDRADVLIENFRPGVLARWNLGYERLKSRNPAIVVAHVTCYGQVGPYAQRPGFGTIAEAMSGFAHVTGEVDGPPTLPPFGLADGVAGLAGSAAVMMALYHRDRPGGSGEGQEIDLSLIEPLFGILGNQSIVYDQLGYVQGRNGNRGSGNNAPRNTFRTKDRKWVAISTSAGSIAARCMELVGHPEVIDEPWFDKGSTRAEHADLLDGMVAEWMAERSLSEVLESFAAIEAAAGAVYDIADIMADPQYAALESIITVDDADFGPVKMPNVMFRMSATPGAVRWTGRRLGADNDVILGQAEEA